MLLKAHIKELPTIRTIDNTRTLLRSAHGLALVHVPRVKLKPVVVALALTTAALWGLSAVGILGSRSNADGAAVESAGCGWQDQQVICCDTLPSLIGGFFSMQEPPTL